MGLNLFKWHSLKTRITLFTLLIFLTSIWILVFNVSQLLRADMQRLLGKQQFSTVSFLAADANRELSDRLDALGRVSAMLDPAGTGNFTALPDVLEARPVLQGHFTGGFFGVDSTGRATAEFPPNSGRLGVNYMDLDTVAAALKDGQSRISQPFFDQKLQAPVFAMTVPLRDGQANVIGAVVGLVNLSKVNFLDQIIEKYYGRSGYFLLVDPKGRQIIVATGKTRIMEPLPATGLHPAFDRFVDGLDGTDITIDQSNVEILASSRRIPVADWFMIAALPTEEAFALIQDMQRNMFQGTLLLTLLAGGLTWWMLRRELLPMLAAVKTLTTLSATNQSVQPLPVASHDEIGDLIDGFNHLLAILAQRETALHESERRFKTLHDASFGGIAIHDQGIIRDCNQGLSELTGFSFEELVGMNGMLLIAPEYREMVMLNIKSGQDHRYDAEGIRKDGSRYHLSIRSKSAPYKGQSLRVTEFRDVSERKEMEEMIRQQALHDTLTKLPNRRLLNDRLRQAMAAGKRSACHSALAFLDLDNFKPLNDAHGHEVGDLLLIEVADRLMTCVRETDTVARFGGDEFVILLSELSADRNESDLQAGIVAEKIRIALSRPYRLTIRHEGAPEKIVEHQCTASVGVCVFLGQAESEDRILKKADSAMYQAKENGRNLVRFYNDTA